MQINATSLRTWAWQKAVGLVDAIAPGDGPESTAAHLDTGRWGEEAAFFFLRRSGFVVVAQGWRSPKTAGDLDLVAWEDDILCFVEVKTRGSRSFATAESAVDRWKRRLAAQYLRQLPDTVPTRFDVLAIYRAADQLRQGAQYELFRNAFGWTEPQD